MSPEYYSANFEVAQPTQSNFENETQLPNWRVNLLFSGLIVGQYLAQIGVFDDTPRIYGTTDDDELLIMPHYKFRTMSPEMVADVEKRKNEGTFIKGVDDRRTRIGSFLNKTNLDEIPFYQLIGVEKWFGDVRALLVREQDNIELKEAASEVNLSTIDIFRSMTGRTGYFCTQHVFGTRVLEGIEAWKQYIKALDVDDQTRPTKIKRARAVFNKKIRKQKKSPFVQEAQVESAKADLGDFAEDQALETANDYVLA